MPILHLAITIVLMSIPASGLVWCLWLHLSPSNRGIRALARHLAPVCLLFLAWGTLVLMFTFSLGPGSFNPAIYWMFFFLGPLLHSYSWAPDLMGFRHRTVVLEPFTCPKRGSEAIVSLAHLSDLHITAIATVEEGLPSEVVLRTARTAIDWALQRADYILISGDLTDSGDVGEWKLFSSLLDSLPDA